MLPKKIRDRKNDLIMYGLTTITISRKANRIKIVHTGNMGNSIDSVRENVDGVFGKGSFNEFRKTGKIISEKGSPDYLYTLVIQF